VHKNENSVFRHSALSPHNDDAESLALVNVNTRTVNRPIASGTKWTGTRETAMRIDTLIIGRAIMTADVEPMRTLDTFILILAIVIIALEALLAFAPKLSVSICTLGIGMGTWIVETLVNVDTIKTVTLKPGFASALETAICIGTCGPIMTGALFDTLINILAARTTVAIVTDLTGTFKTAIRI